MATSAGRRARSGPIEPRPPSFPRTAYDRLLADLAFVDTAERAAGDGCDAILVDTICGCRVGADDCPACVTLA